jgi:hypothetical protein
VDGTENFMPKSKAKNRKRPAAVAGAAPCSAKCHYCESPALYVRRRFVIEKREVEEIPMCLPCLERLAENTKQMIMQVTQKQCAGVDVTLSVHPL